MTKAQKVIGCVQHDCAECKTMRRVYEAAMKWYRGGVAAFPHCRCDSCQLMRACAAAKKGKK